MAATGETSEELQLIEKNPESSQGKTVISDRNNTMEVISNAIQSQLAAILPNMIHETLAQTNLEGAKSSSQTLNTSSNFSSRLAAGSKQGSNEALTVRSAAGSTQGLNNGHVEIIDPPLKKAKLSCANENYSDDLTISAGRWDASEELSSFLDVLFADKPLSVYDRKPITKEFPRPNVESVFTPVLDDYLSSLVAGAKGVDKESKKLQDQILDIVGPLSMAFEHVSSWQEGEDNPGSITLSTEDVDGLYTFFSKALTLLGPVNAQYKVQRRKQVLDKLNPQMSSLSSEPFPEAGKNFFGPSFEEKVKKRNETVKILSQAAPKKFNMQFFRRGISSHFRPGRGVSFVENGQTSCQASQPEGEAHISGAGAGAGEGSQLLNQARIMFHTKAPSNSCEPVKYRYATSKRRLNLSNSEVFVQFRPLFCRG